MKKFYSLLLTIIVALFVFIVFPRPIQAAMTCPSGTSASCIKTDEYGSCWWECINDTTKRADVRATCSGTSDCRGPCNGAGECSVSSCFCCYGPNCGGNPPPPPPAGGGSSSSGGGCNQNNWTYGSCSVSCGGGTQTGTNECGGTFTRACNEQACAPTCTVSLAPNPLEIVSTGSMLASTTQQAGAIYQVDFSSGDDGIATVASPDITSPYSTIVTGVSPGTTSVTATALISGAGGSASCTDTAVVTILAGDPWWQAQDSDITTNGSISSDIPASNSLILNGPGGYPGVAAHGSSIDIGLASISSTSWGANSNYLGKTFNYNFFESQIPTDVTLNSGTDIGSGGTESRGYYWYKVTGDTSLDSVNLGDRKVVLLIEGGDLDITGSITLNDGVGFLVVIVGKDEGGNKGNITVDPGVGGSSPDIEGMFLSEGQFRSGVGATQLHIRGSVAALGGMTLERDLGGALNSSPAELFEFAPDLSLNFPKELGHRRIRWREVAP